MMAKRAKYVVAGLVLALAPLPYVLVKFASETYRPVLENTPKIEFLQKTRDSSGFDWHIVDIIKEVKQEHPYIQHGLGNGKSRYEFSHHDGIAVLECEYGTEMNYLGDIRNRFSRVTFIPDNDAEIPQKIAVLEGEEVTRENLESLLRE